MVVTGFVRTLQWANRVIDDLEGARRTRWLWPGVDQAGGVEAQTTAAMLALPRLACLEVLNTHVPTLALRSPLFQAIGALPRLQQLSLQGHLHPDPLTAPSSPRCSG